MNDLAGQPIEPLHLLLVPMGTPGDVQPFVDIGAEALRRGHAVTMLASEYFLERAEQAGFDFAPVGTMEEYQRLLDDKNLWNPAKSFRVFAKKLVGPTARRMYDAIVSRYEPGRTVVAAQSLALGARVAQDKLGVPTATIHRQPLMLRTVYDSSPSTIMFLPRWMPRPIKALQFHLMDLFVDHAYLPPINALRAELGLEDVKYFGRTWMDSPQRVIGLWPEWFGPVQPDWPEQLRLMGFVAHEQAASEPDALMREFIESEEPPIVFTVGSAMRQGREFYARSAEVCQRLGRRGMLVTSFADQIPKKLPMSVIHVPYVPFTWLLPRAAAIVHHGGVGTVAQALAAGIPQLTLPGLVYDTPDNAMRLKRLGVGRELAFRKYDVPRVTAILRELMEDQTAAANCRALSARIHATDAAGATVDELEALVSPAHAPEPACK